MKNQKQQVISRFFAPKRKPEPSSPSSTPPQSQNPQQTPPSKIAATVSFSPSKRLRTSQFASPSKPSTRPKLSPHTQNPLPSINPSTHQKFLQNLLEPSEHDVRSNQQFSSSKTAPLSSSSDPKYTPLEQQVVELKKKYGDILLMVEVGYRFRFFGEDAENAARVLGIYAHMDHNFLTASVPTFRLNVHVRRLVNAGYKVGVVKQTETAAIKAHGANRIGPFCRGLSALYTRATLEAAEDVGGGDDVCGSCSNYLACIVENGILEEKSKLGLESGFDVKTGFIAVDISTGDVVYGEFNDGLARTGLEALLFSLAPVELLIGESVSKQTDKLLLAYAGASTNVRLERMSPNYSKDGGAFSEVMTLYENMFVENSSVHCEGKAEVLKQQNCAIIKEITVMPDLAIEAMALTISYLRQFGFERILSTGASFRPFSSNKEMTISANALQQLEILKNNSDGSESGSLFHCMNHTITIFGSRLLRHWVTHPLCDRNMISARLDAVSEIAETMRSCQKSLNLGGYDREDSDVSVVQPVVNFLLSSVLSTLGKSSDIQRGITRIYHRTATASEFISTVQAILLAGKQLKQLHVDCDKVEVKVVQSVLLRKLILTASSSSLIGNAAKLLSALNKVAADQGNLENLFVASNDRFPEVARASAAVQLAKEALDSLIDLYCKQLKMRNLEFMSVSGTTHLIELPLNVRVPSDWIRINSTKKTIRYHPPEVVPALDKLSLAKEELTIACRAAWDCFLRKFSSYYNEFQAAVQALAALDCLHSLAVLSRNKNYVRPTFTDDNEPAPIHICSGRHPILELVLQESFVPNDTCLRADKEYCQIVTGPNMGGKSCYIRQVALIAIMAQIGSYVPASSAKLHVLDSIHTRLGAFDSIQKGRSTFLEEMSEASHILHNCTERSLVIMDELGRGTSTHDGVAIAYAALHHLLEQKRCMVLFVTHYPEIIDIRSKFPHSVGAYHVSYLTADKDDNGSSERIQNNDGMDHENVVYLYKLVRGASDQSFGLKVAQLAQLPSSCVRRATLMARNLEAVVRSRVEKRLVDKASPQMEPIEGSQPGKMNSMEDLANTLRNFFSILNSTSEFDDPSICFQYMKHAQDVAKDFIRRQNDHC